MKKYNQIIRRRLFVSMVTNPIVIFVYWLSFYELYELCKYGRVSNNIIILLLCMLFFFALFIFFIIRVIKKRVTTSKQIIDIYEFDESGIKIFQDEELKVYFQDIKSFRVTRKYIFIVLKNKEILVINMLNKTTEEINEAKKVLNTSVRSNSLYKVIWAYIAIIIMILITLFYGVKIYYSAINYNGKLSWVLNDLQSKRTVEFQHNNIYEDGIEGIFTDINEKINMPKNLYVSDSFEIYFDSDGIITSFDTYLYGKNDNGKVESFLITYNKDKSEKITIRLNGYIDADYNEDKLVEPLINTMRVIPIKKTVGNWDENKYGILYYGKRSFGYNTEGIIYVDLEGNIKPALDVSSKIIGYTVSVFVPGKEDIYTPVRYNLTKDLDNIERIDDLNISEREKPSEKLNNGTEKFYLSTQVGYSLVVSGAAVGSRFYSLYGTSDGGDTWDIINEDPFLGGSGGASGITFLNDKLGFLCLSHSGGIYGELYRTEDGGLSYEKIAFDEIKVELNSEKTYNPFDLPEMPYEKDGNLNILIGQGSDGDYNGGSKALYQSKDKGRTWEYLKEVTRDQ